MHYFCHLYSSLSVYMTHLSIYLSIYETFFQIKIYFKSIYEFYVHALAGRFIVKTLAILFGLFYVLKLKARHESIFIVFNFSPIKFSRSRSRRRKQR